MSAAHDATVKPARAARTVWSLFFHRLLAHRLAVGSAVFLAPGAITNLDVDTRRGKRTTRIRFPLVASY